MFLMRSLPSVLTFYVDQKSKMATLAFDWLTYKKLLSSGHFVLSFSLGFTNNTASRVNFSIFLTSQEGLNQI